MILREPLGVVGAVVPWNFPLLMASWKIGPALAAGNSVLLKPAEQSPLSAIRIGELAVEAGLPAGTLQRRARARRGRRRGHRPPHGRRHDRVHRLDRGRQVLPALLRRVEHEARLARVRRQDAEHRASPTARTSTPPPKAAAFGIFYNQGEVCNAGSRLIVRPRRQGRPARADREGRRPACSRATRWIPRRAWARWSTAPRWSACSATSTPARAKARSSCAAAAGSRTRAAASTSSRPSSTACATT